MAIGVAFTGIEHSSNIKFSELRREFKTIQKRSTYSGEDDHSGDSNTISISASELLRNTSGSPNVPDAFENASIPTTQSNWKTSQFTGAVKFYYLNQTGTNDNTGDSTIAGLDLDNPTNSVGESSTDIKNWNNNINKNVNKVAFIDGTIGSLTTNKAALEVDAEVKNLSIRFGSTSKIYGAGGVTGADSNNRDATDGGNAVDFQQASGNIEVYTDSQSLIYAGGGGGGRGGNSGVGGPGGCIYAIYCTPGQGFYSCDIAPRGAGGGARAGKSGGPGRGYNYDTGSLAGTAQDGARTPGQAGSSLGSTPCAQQPGAVCSFAAVSGGQSGIAGGGGDGGDWGEDGDAGQLGGGGLNGTNGGNYLCHNAGPRPNASADQYNGEGGGTGQPGGALGSAGTGIIGDRSVWSWTSGSNTSGIKGGYTGAGP